MKKHLLALCALVTFIPGLFAFNSSEVDQGLDEFVRDIAKTLPDNAVLSGTWSDAYIGQLLSVPPHFGVGASFGGTGLNMRGLNRAADGLSMPPILNDFFLPALGFEGRIGGFFLPFDIGLKFSYMVPSFDLSGNTLKIDHLMAGADIRYAILKQNVILPNLSAGVGYTYVDGSLNLTDRSNNASAGVKYKANIFDASLQISKSFFVITPFVGLRALITQADNSWNYQISSTEAANRYEDVLFSGQVFGGFSINIFIVKLNFNASYNFVTQTWGANGGVRIQL